MIIESNYAGKCSVCQTPHEPGAKVEWKKGRRGVRCLACFKSGAQEDPASGGSAKPLRDNQSRPVDVLARGIADRAWRVARLVEKGESDVARAEALQLAIDLNDCLKDRDYALLLAMPDAAD